jgi:hypothetical protein
MTPGNLDGQVPTPADQFREIREGSHPSRNWRGVLLCSQRGEFEGLHAEGVQGDDRACVPPRMAVVVLTPRVHPPRIPDTSP